MRDLPPTPSKFHYIFNLRDLSRITNGLCLTTPDRFETLDQMLRVWRNECLRVIFDRLINDSDREIVQVRCQVARLAGRSGCAPVVPASPTRKPEQRGKRD